MTWSTRFATAKMDRFLTEAEAAVTTFAQRVYTEAAEEAASNWRNKIPPGRGGSHNDEMKDIEGRVTQPGKGKFFVRMGWLNHPPIAADGRTSWFVYHDVGYDPFGMIKKGFNAQRVPGLLLQLDARRDLQDKLFRANDAVSRQISAAARRTRS